MTNPYTPPQSPLDATPTANGPGTFWKIFFWFNMVMLPLIVIGVAMAPALSVMDVIDVTVYALFLVALYGYVFGKRIGAQQSWKIACYVYPAWFVLYEFVLPFGFGMPKYGDAEPLGFAEVLAVVLGALTLLTFHRYAFRSETLWQNS